MLTRLPASSTPFEPEFRTAFVRTSRARAALDPKDLLPIHLDVVLLVATVLGAVPRIALHREAMKRELPKLPFQHIDRLKTYAQALNVAHIRYRVATTPPSELPIYVARGRELRAQLMTDARALAKRKLVDSRVLARLRGGRSHLSLALDLGVLAVMLRARWSEIEAKCALTLAELDEAETLHEQLSCAIGHRKNGAEATSERLRNGAFDTRQRAYTLVLRTYDQARRAIAFLRWEQRDAESIAPSLWATRVRVRRKKSEAELAATVTPVAIYEPRLLPNPFDK